MSNKNTLHEYFSCIGAGDDYQAYYADDIVWRLPKSHPYGAEHRGLDAVRRMLNWANEEMVNIRSLKSEIHDMIEEGERIAVRMTQSYDSADGTQKYCNEYIDIFEFKNGRISGITAAFDTHAMYRLGLYNATIPAEA